MLEVGTMVLRWAPALALCVGCTRGEGSDDAGTAAPPEQGVTAMIRLPGGEPATDAISFVGGTSRTEPDSAGMVYHLDLPPGRQPVQADLLPHMLAYAAPEVHPEHLGAARLDLLPLTVVDIDDPSQPTTVEGDGFVLEIPAGAAVEVDDAPWTGPWHLGWLVVGEDERRGLPGDGLSVRNDDDLEPFVIERALALRAWTDDGQAVKVPEPVLTLTFADTDAEQAYIYSHGRTYWTSLGGLEVDAGAATLVDFGALGWIAAGGPAPERGCVTGRVVDPGGHGLTGVTVTLLQEGTVGVERATTLDGAFCLPMDPGTGGTIEGYGMAADRSELYTGSSAVSGPAGAGTCPSSLCADVGALEVEVHRDADGDRYFAGPGGDCDDADPEVNPNPAFGDARFCGGGR